MPSTSARCARLAAMLAIALGLAGAGAATAQQQAQGFALERLYPAAPGNGWIVVGDLNQGGGLGGAVSFSTGYAAHPLALASRDGAERVLVVKGQAFATLGAAVTYDRWRLWGQLTSPLYVGGSSGTVDGWQFTGPSTNLEQNPDTFSDVLLGVDARLVGEPGGAARLGVSARLFIPSGERASYITDGTYRGMALLVAAGDASGWEYAAQAGVHLRLLDEPAVPGGPRGHELLFGVAGGARVAAGGATVVIGPEVYGASALRQLFASETTALEALLTARYETRGSDAPVRLKVGVGAGIAQRFGAPEWRAVIAIERQGRFSAR